MKLWQKVFICTLILFELVFNAATGYLIRSNFNQSLQSEVARGLSEHFIIYTGLQSNGMIFKEKFGYTEGAIRTFLSAAAQNYTRYYDQEAFVEILDANDQTVYSSFALGLDTRREELGAPLTEKRKYIIRDIGDQTFLFVTNRISLEGDFFKVTYIRDISEVYASRNSQFGLLMKLNIGVVIGLAVGLYLLLWYLTRSIRRLTDSVQNIAGGNYAERVEIQSRDEVGILAQSFNQMAAAVEGTVEELNRNNYSKQQFIEYLTHELKTPLTSIIGYADFLRSTKCSEENLIKGLGHIYTQGRHLEAVAFKLMDLVLLEKQERILKSEEVHRVCMEVAEIMEPRFNKENIQLIVEVAPCKIAMERDLFKTLLENLLDNAIKASKAGDKVFLRGRNEKDNACILEVEDQGIGIPEKDIARVFEPFFMVDKARSRSKHGVGLGLAICAKIVHLHQGGIQITSQPDMGTKVQIAFPTLYN